MRSLLTIGPLSIGWVLLLGACGGDDDPAPRDNVVLVITDTVRADKLGCYGNPRGLTPNLDRFAAEGVRFENASSHAPWTLPSIATMLTGLHPTEHGAGGRLGDFRPLDGSVTTLPAVFSEAGYATHCIANVGFLQRGEDGFGVTRDFDGLDLYAPASNVEVRDAGRTTDVALEWLDEHGDEPFFLLVHYFDPHAIYAPPQPYRERFALPRDKRDDTFEFPTRVQMMAIRDGRIRPTEPLLRRAEALHDGEIAYMDEQVGRLLDGLAQRGLDGRTAVVITGDHGEEFLDHGGFEHGHQLYQELTHVPLMLRWPGVEPGVEERVVGHVDLAVTLCQFADLAPAEQFTHFGRSLLNEEAGSRPILAHGNMWNDPLTAWRVGDEKLIRRSDGEHELYDLATDAAEQQDLADERPARVAELSALLDETLRSMRSLARGEEFELSEGMREHLKDLGYLGGGDEEEADTGSDGDGDAE